MVVAQRFLYSNGFCISSESPWRSCAWTCIKGCHEKQEEERKSHALFYVLSATRFFISWYLLKMLHVARFYSKRAAVYMGQWLLFCFCFVFLPQTEEVGTGVGRGWGVPPSPQFPLARISTKGRWRNVTVTTPEFLLLSVVYPTRNTKGTKSAWLFIDPEEDSCFSISPNQLDKNKKRHFRTLFTFWYCLQIISAVLWFCANSLWK